MEPNRQLEALLDQSGMSRAGLAARINSMGGTANVTLRYDHTAVARWLKGQRPRGAVPETICDILGRQLGRILTLDDIGMASPSGRRQQLAADECSLGRFLDRVALLWRSDRPQDETSGPALLTGAAAVAPVWEWENPPEDTHVARGGTSGRVTEADVAFLNAARGHYESLYRNAGGVATRPRAVRFLTDEVAPLLRRAYDDPTGRALCRAAGSLAAVCGICAYDADAQGLAQRYFHQALRLAKASGDRLFGGYVIALLVNQALFLGDHRRSLACAEAVLRTIGPHASPALATDLFAMQAKAYAHLGDRRGAHRGMRLAEMYAERIRPDAEPAETGYVQPGLLEVRLAETLVVLGETEAAGRYAREAVRVPAHPRGRVNRLATLADIELRGGEAERAATLAVEMVGHARGIESHRLRGRMRGVRDDLARHPGDSTAEAARRIDEALRVPL